MQSLIIISIQWQWQQDRISCREHCTLNIMFVKWVMFSDGGKVNLISNCCAPRGRKLYKYIRRTISPYAFATLWKQLYFGWKYSTHYTWARFAILKWYPITAEGWRYNVGDGKQHKGSIVYPLIFSTSIYLAVMCAECNIDILYVYSNTECYVLMCVVHNFAYYYTKWIWIHVFKVCS